jgi:hypothetical protein
MPVIYGSSQQEASFRHIVNLFHPTTIALSLVHDSPQDLVPGIKTEEGKWNIRPHCHRVVTITETELELFAKLLEDGNTPPLQARLPQVHAREILHVIRKITQAPKRLMDLEGQYYATEMWMRRTPSETGSITREESPTYQPATPGDWVLSGPHFFVGTPLNKTPCRHAHSNNAYDEIDLTEIPEDYLPRAVYRPGDAKGDRTQFHKKIPVWPGPSLPGFWPVAESELDAWSELLGEAPKLHAKLGRNYVHIDKCTGDVAAAIAWLVKHPDAGKSEAFTRQFHDVTATQSKPAARQFNDFLSPITSRYRYVNRRQLSISTERSLISSIMVKEASHIDGGFSLTFADTRSMVGFAAASLFHLPRFCYTNYWQR